jgi:NleD-like pathogen effector protein (putative zinc metallopeptidase)
MAISSEFHINHLNRPPIQQSGGRGKLQPSSTNPLNQGSGQDLFVNSQDSGFHDFDAAKALGHRLRELGRQQRANGNSAVFGQQVGKPEENLTEMFKDGFDHLTGNKVHYDVLGLKGFNVRGNPVETAAMKQALQDIQSTKTGRHLLKKLAESGHKVQFLNKRDLRIKGKKKFGVTADPGFKKDAEGNYSLKKKSVVIALDLEDIQSRKTMGSFRSQVRDVMAHELGHAYQDIFHPNDVIWGRNSGPAKLEKYARNQWELPIQVEANQNAGVWPMSLPDRRPDTKL